MFDCHFNHRRNRELALSKSEGSAASEGVAAAPVNMPSPIQNEFPRRPA